MGLRNYFRRYFDLDLTLILIVFYLIAVCLNLIRIFSTAYFEGSPLNFERTVILPLHLIDAVVVLSIMQLIAFNTKRLILKRTSWRKILWPHFFIAIVLGFVVQLMVDFYRIQVGMNQEYDFRQSFGKFMSVVDVNFLVYFAMLFIIYTYYYFKIVRANEKQQSTLETQVVTAKMDMLKSQLQPHFLFNTINCIISLIDIDKKKAQDTLVDLSTFFREVTRSSNVNWFTVEKELEILHHYLAILKVRFPDTLHIKEEIDREALSRIMPAMVLQPLVENSINHGYGPTEAVLTITITISVENEMLKVIVENDGLSLDDSSAASQMGVGIQNLRHRLNYLYGSKASFTLQNKKKGKGVENILSLPL